MEAPSGLRDVELYSHLVHEQVLLAYNGEIDGELIDMLVQLTEKALKKASSVLKVRKKIVNILIESLQNTYHYIHGLIEKQDESLSKVIKSPFLIICKDPYQKISVEDTITEEKEIATEDENYWILVGNWIDRPNAQNLKSRIDYLQNLTEDELQEYYIKVLNKDELPTEGGAGLGLIDMMRRSQRQVFFEFKETEEDFSVFMLKIKVH